MQQVPAKLPQLGWWLSMRSVTTRCLYRRYGFVTSPEHPRRLYIRMKDIRASFGPAT